MIRSVAAVALSALFLNPGVSGRTVASMRTVRVCQTPDCLVVTKIHSPQGRVESIGVLDTRLHLYIYVPPGTNEFTVGVFDQSDDGEPATRGKDSRFDLYAPDGSEALQLLKPRANDWSDYAIETKGRSGVWRLSVTGPEDNEKPGSERAPSKAENAFRVRTQGEVDLYMRLDPVARVRGARFGAPRWGGGERHRFAVQMPGVVKTLRLNVLHPDATMPLDRIPLDSEAQAMSVARASLVGDDRLQKGTLFSTIDVTARGKEPLRELWTLDLPTPGGSETYGLGTDYPVRLFFLPDGSRPLMPEPIPTRVRVEGGAATVRATTIGRDDNDPLVAETDSEGVAVLPLVPYPGAKTTITATRGPLYRPATVMTRPGQSVTLTPQRIIEPIPGWFGGDTHCHTAFYDGTDTPAQMVAAAEAEGLDWLCVTEHAHSQWLGRAERAASEAIAATGKGRKILVLPGMEYTGPSFHANILGGTVSCPPGSHLSDLVTAATTGKDVGEAAPLVVLNHPTIGTTARGELTGTEKKPDLVELWNSPEPDATRLWWEQLNAGRHIYAVTGSDSHNRRNAPPGYRRTYVYLGTGVRTAPNVLSALGAGRSFLSRGALLDVSIGGQHPGGTVALNGGVLTLSGEARSVEPIRRIDIVHGGDVVQSFDADGRTRFSFDAKRLSATPGWYLAQAWGKDNRLPLAMTNPVWVAKSVPNNIVPKGTEEKQ